MKIDSVRIFLIIILSLAGLALIIIGIILLIKRFKKSKNEEIISEVKHNNNSNNEIKLASSVVSPINLHTSVHQFDNDINKQKKEKREKDILTKEMKIKGYLDCFLKPVKYSLIKVYNESCPIDLIPFNENDEVSVTKCLHAFHYNCIKNYLLENENHNEYKCPICLTVLFEV